MKLEIIKANKSILLKDIEELESKFDFKFPKDYKGFLLEFNGGETPIEYNFKYTNTNFHDSLESIEVEHFYNIDELKHDLDVIYKTKRDDVHPVEDDIFLYKILRIADTYNDFNVGIRLSEEDFGSIYILDTPHGEKLKIANSFHEFINGFEFNPDL